MDEDGDGIHDYEDNDPPRPKIIINDKGLRDVLLRGTPFEDWDGDGVPNVDDMTPMGDEHGILKDGVTHIHPGMDADQIAAYLKGLGLVDPDGSLFWELAGNWKNLSGFSGKSGSDFDSNSNGSVRLSEMAVEMFSILQAEMALFSGLICPLRRSTDLP